MGYLVFITVCSLIAAVFSANELRKAVAPSKFKPRSELYHATPLAFRWVFNIFRK